MNFGENLKIFLSKNNMTMTALSKRQESPTT